MCACECALKASFERVRRLRTYVCVCVCVRARVRERERERGRGERREREPTWVRERVSNFSSKLVILDEDYKCEKKKKKHGGKMTWNPSQTFSLLLFFFFLIYFSFFFFFWFFRFFHPAWFLQRYLFKLILFSLPYHLFFTWSFYFLNYPLHYSPALFLTVNFYFLFPSWWLPVYFLSLFY